MVELRRVDTRMAKGNRTSCALPKAKKDSTPGGRGYGLLLGESESLLFLRLYPV